MEMKRETFKKFGQWEFVKSDGTKPEDLNSFESKEGIASDSSM
jgi:hypothetical protein